MGKQELVTVPDLGDFTDVDVVEVLVAVGDEVAEGDALLVLETDKASLEVPAPWGGVVVEVLLGEGDRVSVGDGIVRIEVVGGEVAHDRDHEVEVDHEHDHEVEHDHDHDHEVEVEVEVEREVADGREGGVDGTVTRGRESVPHASPTVRRMAGELGVPLQNLDGSGPHGRILEGDVKAWVAQEMSTWREPEELDRESRTAARREPTVSRSERVDLSRIRRRSAANLQASWQRVPQVTHHEQADVTELEVFRREQQAEARTHGFGLSPLPFVVLACARALRTFPRFNASLATDGDALLVHRAVNIGVAVDTPDGLLVPVVRDADRKGVMELARELAEVSERVRGGKATMQDLSGGTFTVSSLGSIGGTGFTPLVKEPEVAILGVSRLAWQQVWRGEAFEPRRVLPLSLSYDHRVIDGAAAARFCVWLSRALGDLKRLLL